MAFQRPENFMVVLPFRHPAWQSEASPHHETGFHGRVIVNGKEDWLMRMVGTYGEYNEDEVAVMTALCRPSSLVVDVGANIGLHTLALAEHCIDGTVVAIEPQRLPYQQLCGNLSLNGVFNVDAMRAAAGSRHGGLVRVPNIDPYINTNTLGLTVDPSTDEGDATPAITLDGLGLPTVDLLKIDVEGMEPDVLEGAQKLIEAYHPVLYMEFNWNQTRLINWCRGRGYELWKHSARHCRPDNFLGVELGANPGDPHKEEFERQISPMLLAIHRDSIPPQESGSVANDLDIMLTTAVRTRTSPSYGTLRYLPAQESGVLP